MASVVSTELMAYTLAVSGKSQPQLIAFARYQCPNEWATGAVLAGSDDPPPTTGGRGGRRRGGAKEEEERGPTP